MNKLFCDLKTYEEKAGFFLSGRGYETGVIAHSIQNDVAMAYHRCTEYKKELAALQDERENLRKDAERYRWLRERIAGKEHVEDEFIGHPGYALSEEMAPEIDAAIDAAMNATA